MNKTFSKLSRVLLGTEPDNIRPVLEQGEAIIREGRAERVRTLRNSPWGFVILTNRRLLWHERKNVWRNTWIVRKLNLLDIATVDRGNLLHFLLGGRRLRLRLRDRKGEFLFQGGIEDTLDQWVATIRRKIADAEVPGASA